MLPFALGLVAIAVALFLLSRLKHKDLADTAAVLGLSVVARGAQSRGTTAEGFDFHQSVVAQGMVAGVPAELASRIIRTRVFRKARRTPTQVTVLTLRPRPPIAVTLRLQPSGMMRDLERLVHDPPTALLTGDGPFDTAYHLYAADGPRARAVLTDDLRKDLLAFRATAAVSAPGAKADYMTSANLLGTFEVSQDAASYYVYGSPTRKLAEHLRRAAPLLAAVADLRQFGGEPR